MSTDFLKITSSESTHAPMRWAVPAAANPKKDVRSQLCGIRFDADKERIITTDGHRLHLWRGLYPGTEGLYEIIKANTREVVLMRKPEAPAFPNVDQLIDTQAPDLKCPPLNPEMKEWSYLTMITWMNPGVTYQDIRDKKSGVMLVKWEYFLDALKCPEPLYFCSHDNGRLQLASETMDYLVLLMAMRV